MYAIVMRMLTCGALVLSLFTLLGSTARGEKAEFKSRELFRIPFGQKKSMLGARVDRGLFRIPRTFTMDSAGHFYIDDINNHRIVRFNADGTYEMDFRYIPTARQVFAHPDSHRNLWLLISDPAQGLYYGVYSEQGKTLRSGIFSKFNRFRLHVDDQQTLHILLSSDKESDGVQTYILDENRLLMKKENIPRPPEGHHRLQREDRTFYMDALPDGTKGPDRSVTRITDDRRRNVADIEGSVIAITGHGEIYTRVGKREIRVYEVSGRLKGKVVLTGLSSSCQALRFGDDGSLYQLDGIPDQTEEDLRRQGVSDDIPGDPEDRRYTPAMSGMRVIRWERQ